MTISDGAKVWDYIRWNPSTNIQHFNVQNYIGAWDNVPQELMNDYKVEDNDIKIIKQRINERRPKKTY